MKDGGNPRLLLRGGVVALAVVVALIAWLSTRGDSAGGEEAASPPPSSSRIVSAAELGEVAVKLGQPVYWAGPQSGDELELTELGEGGTQVSYVPKGTEAGEGSALLTIGSYPLPDPKAALERFAGQSGAIVRRAKNGREVVSSEKNPTSAYFVSPDNSVQVEVYNPSPRRAMSLALSRRVQPAH
jgi:hypothetical protein